jgi:transmembrane sensor
MKDLEHYKNCSHDDFIVDEEFREMVLDADSETRLSNLISVMPEKGDEINLAVKIIKGLQMKPIQQSPERQKELWHEILLAQKKKTRLTFFLKIAASLLLIFGIGSTIVYFSVKQNEKQVPVMSKAESNDAKLILANGQTVLISNKQSKLRFSPNGTKIVLNDSSDIAQSVGKDIHNQLIVPFGKRSNIILSDGTRVFLNSGSRLEFPPVFAGKSREVILEGEAYFEVTPDKEKPFYVKTAAFTMKVYGTKFNVQAYQSDEASNIVLVEGKVSMNSSRTPNAPELFLAPNQKASISRGVSDFVITNVENTDNYTGWVQGYLTFTNEEISNVLMKVSRYYNVEIITDLPENKEKIYGKLDLKDNLERVLDGIAFISKTKYQKQTDKYVFMVEKPL